VSLAHLAEGGAGAAADDAVKPLSHLGRGRGPRREATWEGEGMAGGVRAAWGQGRLLHALTPLAFGESTLSPNGRGLRRSLAHLPQGGAGASADDEVSYLRHVFHREADAFAAEA
jgi:hypothetical protein